MIKIVEKLVKARAGIDPKNAARSCRLAMALSVIAVVTVRDKKYATTSNRLGAFNSNSCLIVGPMGVLATEGV